MDLLLADKTVSITGASGGIGRALAQAFAEEGSRLVLHGATRFEELERWVGQQTWHERALCVRADVRSPTELEAAFAKGAARFGRVDVCVANAGAWPREPLLLHKASEARIRDTLDANLLGSIWTARAFLAQLERSGPRSDGHGASLVFIGSTAGRFGERHHADYATAKSGLHGLMMSLKNEIATLDPYARVNLVHPGWTVTHLVRRELEQPGVIRRVTSTMSLRQLARAADVARAVTFLSSHAMARHVSGETLTVAGGMEGRRLWADEEIDEQAVRERLKAP
jgi:3-oxoacyl-[acyl-carrier protein] reductase